MVNLVFTKIVRFFYRIFSKLINFCLPYISKFFIIIRINSRVINQLNKLRSNSHHASDHSNFILELLGKDKLNALDIGAQGGFFGDSIFQKKYDSFFSPIVVEPIKGEAEKLIHQNYQVIQKGLWSSNCKKKLYILENRSGSSSMYKPNKDTYGLYNLKEKDFSLFNITNEIEVECTTIKESLNSLGVVHLDFLKIDTQGSELEILKGLGDYRPLMIKIEVQVVSMYKDVPSWTELLNHLNKTNYMTCEWINISPHSTRSPVEMDMIFIPNYLNEIGKKLIQSKEKEFISLMLVFGQIKLLQVISKHLEFSTNEDIQKLKDKFFY